MLKTNTKIAAGYARVSTREQARDGSSLDLQKSRITAYCEAKGWTLFQMYSDEGESAKSLDREGLGTMIADLKHNEVDVVVVLKLDRLTRSVRDLGTLMEDLFKGVALASVEESLDGSTANGRMVMNMIGSLAQWEREIISERTSAGMQHRRDVEGRWMGRVPYGFRIEEDTGRLVEHASQMKAIVAMKRASRKGRSLSKIAEKHGVSKSLVFKLVNTDLRCLKKAVRRRVQKLCGTRAQI